MTSRGMLVGLGATRAAWSAELRSYVRDHTTGMTTETIFDSRQLARPGKRRFDAVVVDDVSRMFGAADIGRVVEAGTVVIGLYDSDRGLGRTYLESLGVNRLLPANVPTAELARVVAEIGPVNGGLEEPAVEPGGVVPGPATPGRRGLLTVFSAVSGGSGVTETVVAMAECWAKRWQVLVVEANPIAATLAARLRRDPYYGLGWALGRVAQGRRAFPEGLSPPLLDMGGRLGSFDVICQTALPGGPPPVNAVHVGALVEEGLSAYDLVIVDAGPLVGSASSGGADWFSAGRAVLLAADRVVVFAGADPEGALRLVEWRAASVELAVTAPVWAVFGRVPGRGVFEGSQLARLVEDSTGRDDFVGVRGLPEDPTVGRARWNGELVWRGRWLDEVEHLAGELAALEPSPATSPAPIGEPRRVSLASEVGW